MSEIPHVRITDNEREQALRDLSAHFSSGRLTMPEFDLRTAAALAATTSDDLADLFHDLPAAIPAVPGAAGGRVNGWRAAAAVVAVVAILVTVAAGTWIPLLIAALTISALLVRGRRR